MDTPVIVALISSLGSLLVAAGTASWSARQNSKARALQRELSDRQSKAQKDLEELKHNLTIEEKEEERRFAAIGELNRLREPLMVAASELGDRIDNIRHRGFLGYLGAEGQRRDTALQSTLFRFARYFGRLESLYSVVSIMRFERDEDTKVVAGLLADIGRAFSSDRWRRFMLWRQEQRVIGELMLKPAGGSAVKVIGYADFVTDYESRFKRWFAEFAEDLESDGVEGSERLAILQHLFAKLVIQLDEPGDYIERNADGQIAKPQWVVRSMR